MDIPKLNSEQQQRSQLLIDKIIDNIDQAGGVIGFDHFMDIVLYDQDYGYYCQPRDLFGSEGDFITAPESSSLYSYVIARQCCQILESCSGNNILEIGAGSGVLARDVLLSLKSQSMLPDKYYILEQSPTLKQFQQSMLQHSIPELMNVIDWVDRDSLPNFSGVVLANEVFDALPFKRILVSENQLTELMVSHQDNELIWNLSTEDKYVSEYVEQYVGESFLKNTNYKTEIHNQYQPLLQDISACLTDGVVLIMDYGLTKREYYSQEKNNGTMRCFYRHRVHDDPFLNIGFQDITCDVQFSGIVEMALKYEFNLLGYTTQANFLLGNKIDQIYSQITTKNLIDPMLLAQQLKTLTMPDEMGERFKVMALGKKFSHVLQGFSFKDHSYAL